MPISPRLTSLTEQYLLLWKPYPAILQWVNYYWLSTQIVYSTYSFLHTAMADFVPVVQTLTFNSNVSLCVDVEINDDSVLEDTETFSITLSSSDPQVIVGAVGLASIIISDDDCKLSPHYISSLDSSFVHSCGGVFAKQLIRSGRGIVSIGLCQCL